MSLIKWSDKMSVGNAALDKDHQKLLTILNKAHGVMRGKLDRSLLNSILSELDHYTEYHFEMEERLMRMSGYEGLEAHRDQHAGLRQRVKAFSERFNRDPENFPVIEMFDFLSDWMMRHILREDMKLGKALQEARQRKKAPKTEE